MSSQLDDTNAVSVLIKKAFGNVNFPNGEIDTDHPIYTALLNPAWEEPVDVGLTDDDTLDSSDYADLHANLAMLSSKAIHYVLPRLMLAHLRKNPHDVLYVEDIIKFLNVPSFSSPELLTEVEASINQFLAEAGSELLNRLEGIRPIIVDNKEAVLILVDRFQAQAIFMWLETVRTWFSEESIYDRAVLYQIDLASDYWNKRANVGGT